MLRIGDLATAWGWCSSCRRATRTSNALCPPGGLVADKSVGEPSDGDEQAEGSDRQQDCHEHVLMVDEKIHRGQ